MAFPEDDPFVETASTERVVRRTRRVSPSSPETAEGSKAKLKGIGASLSLLRRLRGGTRLMEMVSSQRRRSHHRP